jgi:PiT family inorganic phosphate transporter
MGLIMLILIGTVPTAYALNRALPDSQVAHFEQTSAAASAVIAAKGAGYSIIGDPRPAVTLYVSQHKISEGTYPSLAVLVKDIGEQVQRYGSLSKVPAESVGNTRNDMYLASEAIRFLMKDKESDLGKDDVAKLNAYDPRARSRRRRSAAERDHRDTSGSRRADLAHRAARDESGARDGRPADRPSSR